jgi:hypothetical protein
MTMSKAGTAVVIGTPETADDDRGHGPCCLIGTEWNLVTTVTTVATGTNDAV